MIDDDDDDDLNFHGTTLSWTADFCVFCISVSVSGSTKKHSTANTVSGHFDCQILPHVVRFCLCHFRFFFMVCVAKLHYIFNSHLNGRHIN